MDKPKAKRGDRRLSERSFIGLWAGSSVVLWLILWTFFSVGRWSLSQRGEYYSFTFNMLAFLFFSTGIALIIAHFQRRIGAQYFKQTNGWEFVSVLGVLASLLIFDGLRPTDLLISTMTLLMPMALAQTIWLWRYVKTSWLWLLANLIGVMLFTIPFFNYDTMWETGLLPFFVLLMGLIQGVIQAKAMQYVWTQPRDSEKRKMDLATEGQSEHARVQRLEEREANDTFEAVDDDQIAEYEAR